MPILMFIEPGVDARQRPIAPAFEPVYWHRDLTRDGMDRPAAQFPSCAPLITA
jgi:hypothetical protein